MIRKQLHQRRLEQYQREELSEHYEESRKYFFNIFTLALFVGVVLLFVAVQNHYAMYTQYKQYDLARFENNSIDDSVLNRYEQVKGAAALTKWEQYKSTVKTSSLPITDQNYILAQKALLLDLPTSDELKDLSNYFEYQVNTEDLDYVDVDHNILNSFIFAYSPYYGADRKMLVKLQADVQGEIKSKIVREKYTSLFVYNTFVMMDKWNKPVLPFIPYGVLYLMIFGFVFAIIYGVFKNLAAKHEVNQM